MNKVLILIDFITAGEIKATQALRKAVELSNTSEVSVVTFFIEKDLEKTISKYKNIHFFDLSCFPSAFNADTTIVYSDTMYRLVKHLNLRSVNFIFHNDSFSENEMQLEVDNRYLSHFKRQQAGIIKNKNIEIEKLKFDLSLTRDKLEVAEDKYNAISNAFFWKISAPLRSLIIKLKGLNKETGVRKTDSDIVKKTLQWFQDGSEVIILVSEKHCLYASLLKMSLEKIGIIANISSQYRKENENVLHFVIDPKQFVNFPKYYVFVQTDDSTKMKVEDNPALKDAIGILDVSLFDIQYLKASTSFQNKIFYVPFALNKDIRRGDNYVSDVLVCLNETDPRQQSIYRELSKYFDVIKYDYNFSNEIPSARISVILNESEDSGTNSELLYKLLSFDNTHLISEITYDLKYQNSVKNKVDFIQYNDMNLLIDKIKRFLNSNEMSENVISHYDSSFSVFEYYFYRFLLANDWMSFDDFYQRTNKAIHFNGNRICLSLPEDLDRREAFELDNIYGFEFFPALRHIKGWIGCGMSYKYIMKKALEQDIENLIVCEDDTYFPEDFETRFEHCLKYLKTNSSWDIFQGVIADVGDVKTKNVEEVYGETFVTIDHMMSMVFNIYSKDIYSKIIQWDETNYDLETNTIDRALEGYDLNVVTTSPFLVGHKEDLYSTIWGFNNAQYHDWINKSNEKIKQLISCFKKSKEL